jgi:hypothetical protein
MKSYKLPVAHSTLREGAGAVLDGTVAEMQSSHSRHRHLFQMQ